MNTTYANQEYRATKLFLILFYLIVFVYDFFYFYVLPIILDYEIKGHLEGIGIWYIIVLLLLIPFTIYLYRNNKVGHIKYYFFVVFTLLIFVDDIFTYYGTDLEYASGPVLELVIILLSPIFVNKRFFWVVCLGTISKYGLVGLIMFDPEVLFPIVLVALLSVLAYLMLNRIKQYVDSIESSYEIQFQSVVKGIVTTLELKDPYTSGHSERVAKYAAVIAKNLNTFSSNELRLFNYACLLHDVGKVNIPDHILMKPGKLTKEEYEVIKTHPEIGAEAINGIKGFENCIDVIKYHHERWDGKGYPAQLKGEEIPLLARVTAIADAYDAMTSSRSYRGALSSEVAYQQIVDGQGNQFDPKLVEVFRKVFPDIIKEQSLKNNH